MKKLPKITCCLFLAISPLIVIIAIFSFCIMLNDIKTKKLANEMLNGPIPDSTEVIEIISRCGNITGTGDDVEIWIGLLVKSEFSKEKLLEFYSNLYGKLDVHVSEVETVRDSYSFNSYYFRMEILGIEFNSLKNLSNYDNHFIIERTGEAVFPNSDIRGF